MKCSLPGLDEIVWISNQLKQQLKNEAKSGRKIPFRSTVYIRLLLGVKGRNELTHTGYTPMGGGDKGRIHSSTDKLHHFFRVFFSGILNVRCDENLG